MGILISAPRLLGRRVRLTIDDMPFTQSEKDDDLRIKFSITRTDSPEPDRAEVLVTNMSLDKIKLAQSRWRLTQTDPLNFVSGLGVPANLKIYAGYRDLGLSGLDELIFTGDLVNVESAGLVGATETGLVLKAGDGLDDINNGFIQQSFSGVTLDKLIKAAGVAMGIAFSQDAEVSIGKALIDSSIKRTPHGFIAEGKASDVMNDVADNLGLKWWVADKQIQMVRKFAPLLDFAIALSPESGLLDSTVFKANGDCEFQTLMDPRIKPGRQITVEDAPNPTYRVDACRYQGDTGGSDWYVTGRAQNSFSRPNVLDILGISA